MAKGEPVVHLSEQVAHVGAVLGLHLALEPIHLVHVFTGEKKVNFDISFQRVISFNHTLTQGFGSAFFLRIRIRIRAKTLMRIRIRILGVSGGGGWG